MRTLCIAFSILFGAAALTACKGLSTAEPDLSRISTQELARLLDDTDSGDTRFLEIVDELASRGPAAAPAAPSLARAIAKNRRDSSYASRGLAAIGQAAAPAIPQLLENLANERADVRSYSAYALGAMGGASTCAVPRLASLLWDDDPLARSVAAASLEAVTGVALVDSYARISRGGLSGMPLDEPEGGVSAKARDWWLATGSQNSWPTEGCDS